MTKPKSLASLLPQVSPVLGMASQALYERQRVLVRKGLLKKPVGRGRGSGETATLDAVAILVATVLMTDSLCKVCDLDNDEIRKLAASVGRCISKGSSLAYHRPSPATTISTVVTLSPAASRIIREALSS